MKPWSIIICFSVSMCGVSDPAFDRDYGQYTQVSPETKEFFNSLKSGNGIPCCDTSDGRRIDDADWDTQDNHYRVRIEGEWYDVPTEAVVNSPNKVGYAVVWPVPTNSGNSRKYFIRCFIPGTYV